MLPERQDSIRDDHCNPLLTWSVVVLAATSRHYQSVEDYFQFDDQMSSPEEARVPMMALAVVALSVVPYVEMHDMRTVGKYWILGASCCNQYYHYCTSEVAGSCCTANV